MSNNEKEELALQNAKNAVTAFFSGNKIPSNYKSCVIDVIPPDWRHIASGHKADSRGIFVKNEIPLKDEKGNVTSELEVIILSAVPLDAREFYLFDDKMKKYEFWLEIAFLWFNPDRSVWEYGSMLFKSVNFKPLFQYVLSHLENLNTHTTIIEAVDSVNKSGDKYLSCTFRKGDNIDDADLREDMKTLDKGEITSLMKFNSIPVFHRDTKEERKGATVLEFKK